MSSLLSLDVNDINGVVLLLYGTGNAPSNANFLSWLQKYVSNLFVILVIIIVRLDDGQIPVVVVSQVLKGVVSLGDYAAGSQLLRYGVISGGDMTPEAAVAKLSYLLGKGYTIDEIKSEFGMNLEGEITVVSVWVFGAASYSFIQNEVSQGNPFDPVNDSATELLSIEEPKMIVV